MLGELGGDLDGQGVSGLCPDAVLSCVSHGALGSSQAIRAAAGFLRPGDVLLLEMHRPGPRFAYADRQDQRGFIAVEWWPDDLLAIQDAVARGIVVVEAAGNGAEDLDDALYDTPGPAFPAGWRNPFAAGEDSGAKRHLQRLADRGGRGGLPARHRQGPMPGVDARRAARRPAHHQLTPGGQARGAAGALIQRWFRTAGRHRTQPPCGASRPSGHAPATGWRPAPS